MLIEPKGIGRVKPLREVLRIPHLRTRVNRASTAALASRRSYHHEHADDADRSSQQIPLVWSEPVYDDPPRQRERNEDASVSSVDSPELRDGLQCGYHPVDRENSRPYQRPQEGLVFAHPPPHEVAAPDLAQASQHEQPPDEEQPLHLLPPVRLRNAEAECSYPRREEDRACLRRARRWCGAWWRASTRER